MSLYDQIQDARKLLDEVQRSLSPIPLRQGKESLSVKVYVSRSELEIFNRAAKQAGMSRSEFLRSAGIVLAAAIRSRVEEILDESSLEGGT